MKIILNSGREIILSSIYQNHTYSGLLCGYPNKKMNDMNIKKAMRSARNKMDSKATYLVPPPLLEVKIDDSVKQFYADEEVMRIPSITCYAQFESSSIKPALLKSGVSIRVRLSINYNNLKIFTIKRSKSLTPFCSKLT